MVRGELSRTHEPTPTMKSFTHPDTHFNIYIKKHKTKTIEINREQAQVAPRACFPSSKDWELLQGYLGYLAKYFVAPELQKMVLENNGGLITRRTVRERERDKALVGDAWACLGVVWKGWRKGTTYTHTTRTHRMMI